jgi:hypothetical protein
MATETSTASTETVQQLVNTEQQQNPTPANEPIVQEDPKSQFNFASFDCGAGKLNFFFVTDLNIAP